MLVIRIIKEMPLALTSQQLLANNGGNATTQLTDPGKSIILNSCQFVVVNPFCLPDRIGVAQYCLAPTW